MSIRVFVGLGNPGAEHHTDRHNAGFWALDFLAREWNVHFNRQAKFFGEVGKTQLHGQDIWLLKPSTYMNLSGQAVAALANFYRIAPEQIMVLHDELDLMPGEFKLKLGGGNSGHNGLKDIQARLGTANFWRTRLGIGHPRTLELQQAVVDFVLKAPRKEHRDLIDDCIELIGKSCQNMVSDEMATVVMHLHRQRKISPPPSP
jgi:peptidyl-tRNA hydrolase, PTH1 family